MRKNLFNTAWEMVKKLHLTMSEALQRAWKCEKLRKAMKNAAVVFKFRKVDGSLRVAYGTMSSAIVPKGDNTSHQGTRKTNLLVQVYYDLEKKAFRSFRKENLI